MPPHSPDWSALDNSLQHAGALALDLQTVLIQERQALEQRDYHRFDQLLDDKQRLVGELEQNTAARRQWLAAHGLNDDAESLAQVQLRAPAVAARWRDSAEHWRVCRELTQINEQVCNRTRAVVERVLDILQGQPTQGATYDARGQAQRQQSGRTITSA